MAEPPPPRATATENPRYAVTGVLWELEGDVARLVAADGRRLAVVQGNGTPHGEHDTKGQAHVVPTKAMQLLERNLQDPDERVHVSLRPNEALFKTERAMIYSRLAQQRTFLGRDSRILLPQVPSWYADGVGRV
jgi:DNA polymerase-3 subunit beta